MKKQLGEFRNHPCPKCGRTTKQVVALYNPDDVNGGEVWKCIACKENIEWVNRKIKS